MKEEFVFFLMRMKAAESTGGYRRRWIQDLS